MKKYHFGSEDLERKCEICGQEAFNKQSDRDGNIHDVCLKEDCNKRLNSKIEREKN